MPPKPGSKKKGEEEEPKGPDETEVRQSAVIASTFANVELQTTRQTLQQYVQLFNTAREENQRLAHDIEERDKDAIKVVKYLRDELEKKGEALNEQQKRSDAHLAKEQARWNEERQQLMEEMRKRDDQIVDLQTVVDRLNADIEALAAFKRERHNMHLEMTQFKDRQKEEVARYEAEISRLRFQSLEEKVRLKAEERAMEEKFEAEVNERAMALLDPRTKEIHGENFTLLQDKLMLEKELETMSAEHRAAIDQATVRRRDAELSTQSSTEMAQKSVKQGVEIKHLMGKVKQLEQNLKDVVQEYETRIADDERRIGNQVQTLTTERDQAYKNAESRHRELVKMRTLTRQVIKQRTELEAFFHEALDFVKDQIARERTHFLKTKDAPLPITAKSKKQKDAAKKQQVKAAGQQHPFFSEDNFEPLALGENSARGDNSAPNSSRPHPESAPPRKSSTTSLPPLGSIKSGSRRSTPSNGGPSAPPSVPPSAPAGVMTPLGSQREPLGGTAGQPPPSSGSIPGNTDISQLSWTDKERVLRILFAKINSTKADSRGPSAPTGGGSLDVPKPPSILPPNVSSSANATMLSIEDRPDATFITNNAVAVQPEAF